jgi:chromosome segregation ATPase
MSNLDLPDLNDLPDLDDSERLANLYRSIGEAKQRREELRERAQTIEQEELPQAEEEVEATRVAVATGDQTEEDLEQAKAQRAELEAELEDLRENEIPAQVDTVELLADKRSEIREEEGDKLAGAFQAVQIQLQRTKQILLERLATVCDELDSYKSKKTANEVGSYKPDVPPVPPVDPLIRDSNGRNKIEPFDLRKHAEEIGDRIETMEDE